MLLASPIVATGSEPERLRMVEMPDPSAKTSPKQTVEVVCRAFNSEDLDLFEKCFVESRRKTIRRKCAMSFVRQNCSMSVAESHVIEIDEDSAELVVRYLMGEHGSQSEFVSTVKFVKSGNEWLIDREVIVSQSRPRQAAAVAVARPANANRNNWDPMNPDTSRISPTLQHLVGDIGIQEGLGCENGNCAGGRCANGRCEVR